MLSVQARKQLSVGHHLLHSRCCKRDTESGKRDCKVDAVSCASACECQHALQRVAGAVTRDVVALASASLQEVYKQKIYGGSPRNVCELKLKKSKTRGLNRAHVELRPELQRDAEVSRTSIAVNPDADLGIRHT